MSKRGAGVGVKLEKLEVIKSGALEPKRLAAGAGTDFD